MKKLLVAVSLLTLSFSSFAKLSIVDYSNEVEKYDLETGLLDVKQAPNYEVSKIFYNEYQSNKVNLIIPKSEDFGNKIFDQEKLSEKVNNEEYGYFTIPNTLSTEDGAEHFMPILKRLHMSPKNYYLLTNYDLTLIPEYARILDVEANEIKTLSEMAAEAELQRVLKTPRNFGEYLYGVGYELLN